MRISLGRYRQSPSSTFGLTTLVTWPKSPEIDEKREVSKEIKKKRKEGREKQKREQIIS